VKINKLKPQAIVPVSIGKAKRYPPKITKIPLRESLWPPNPIFEVHNQEYARSWGRGGNTHQSLSSSDKAPMDYIFPSK